MSSGQLGTKRDRHELTEKTNHVRNQDHVKAKEDDVNEITRLASFVGCEDFGVGFFCSLPFDSSLR